MADWSMANPMEWKEFRLLKNILISSFRMKNINFRKSFDLLQLYQKIKKEGGKGSKILYKYDKRAISIQQMFIKENISSKGKAIIDTFHLPYSYKYDSFCDFVFYQENYGKFKQVGLRAEL